MSNNRVTRFNFAVGNEPQLDNFFGQAKRQLEFLLEEVKEGIKACEEYDAVEVLDAVVDCWYIREYLDDLCFEQGMRLQLARDLVCDNNDTKFTTEYTSARLTQEAYEKDGVPCYIATVDYDEQIYYTVRRESDGKVLKPKNFVPVDLSSAVPKEIN